MNALRVLWQLLRPSVAMLAGVLALVLALAGGAWWLIGTPAGAAWLLPRLPGVQAEDVQGRLLGPQLSVRRLVVQQGPQELAIDDLRIEGLSWTWRPAPSTWIGLRASALTAARVVLQTGPASATPASLPASLQWPLRLDLPRVQVGELQVDGLAPLRDLRLALQAGEQAGEQHRIDELAFVWDRLQASGGGLTLQTTAPFALQGTLQLAERAEPAKAPRWQADVLARGTLERLTVAATLRGGSVRPGAGAGSRNVPSLDAQAELAPFAPWPLRSLVGRTQALDLSALVSGWPQTRLAGQVDISSSSRDAPVGAELRLDNLLPGRWEQGRLPLTRLAMSLRADPKQPDRLQLGAFTLALGDAGTWRGSGRWQGPALQLETQLDTVRPQQLQTGAAAMSLSGPLALTLSGLPSPDTLGEAAWPPLKALVLELRGTLDGRLAETPQPLRVEFDARVSDGRLQLRTLQAGAGAAAARGQLQALRGATGGWQVSGDLALSRFDPLPWWSGAPEALRRGPYRLSADARFELQLPPGALQMTPLALAPRLAGSGRLEVRDSLIAGVPLTAALQLGRDAGTPDTPSRLRGDITLGGNRLAIDAAGNPLGDGRSDQVKLDLQAGDVATLAPLLRLWPELAAWAPRQGRLDARVEATGRWPVLRTSGQVRAERLQLGTLALQSGDASWTLGSADTSSGEPLSMRLQATGFRWGEQRVAQLRAEVGGTWARHQIQLNASFPRAPPDWLADLSGQRARAGMLAELRADGRWSGSPAGGIWRAEVSRLRLAGWDGRAALPALDAAGGTAIAAPAAPAAPAPPAAPSPRTATAEPADWLDLRNLRAELRFGPGGELLGGSAEPGRARVAGVLTLAWQRAELDLTGARAAYTLRAEVAPFAVAPLLARAQPSMGWGGDLSVRAALDLRAAERFDANVSIERADGDLTTGGATSPAGGGMLLLGLTELRLGLTARDGQWLFSQAMNGRTLGEVAATLRVRTAPADRWPGAEAPIDGQLDARVGNLGIWSAWAPPGWRLGGTLRTSVAVGGRFGAPEYRGELRASRVAVSNPLQGVALDAGEVLVTLQGDRARIDTFTLRGGEGTLSISGSAALGAQPSAQLQLQAQRFRVLGRVDRQLVVSGSAELALAAARTQLDGRFRVDEGLFDAGRADAPTLDDDVSVRRPGDPPVDSDADAVPTTRRDLRVGVDIDLGERLRVRGRGLDTTLRGRVRVSTPGGRLAVVGSVRAVEGTYAAYGQRLEIERGVVEFSGSLENPRLDILALRPNLDQRVGVLVSGSALAPRARLYSEPDMSDTDKLSWLVLGRPSGGLARTDTALLQRAAVALLAGEGEAPTDRLLRNLGLDELSLRQSDGEVRETVVTVGKQLSRRWYVGYERGVNAATGTWQLIYRIAQRFTLRAQSGLDNSLDLIWIWRLD